MSWRLRAAAVLLRAAVRPRLRRTRTPAEAAADFSRAAPLLLCRPPFLRDLVRPCGGVATHWIAAGPCRPDRVVLWLHGGAFLSGSGATHAGMLGRLSRLSGVEVAAPDYRLLQQAPFPAALEDARAVWDGLALLGYRGADIVLGGDSAGGGLALALLAGLLARGECPAGAVLFSPWTDLTLSDPEVFRRGRHDPLLPVERMAEVRDLYLAGADPTDPRASPVLADFAGAPPVLIQTGAEEALRSDSERVAARIRATGGEVTLELWPGCPHVWQMGDGWLPEARAALRTAARFVQISFDRTSR
jgi:acetyl esterase/lipase